MADIFTGNGLSLSYNPDTGNRSPQGIGNVQINEVAEFPVLEIESEVNQYDTYNSTYNSKLLAEKSANPVDIVVNYLPDDSTHQFLDEAAENQDVFQLTIAYQEEGSQLTYAMVNGAITSTQLSGDKDSVVTKTYEFTPTDVVARSQAITALLPVYQGDYGVGSNTTDVPQYAPAIPTGNSFIKVPSTQAGNPAGADMMGIGLVDGSSVSSLAMTKSGTLSIYAKNATTAWTRIYTATQMDARYVPLTRTVNGKQLSTDIVLTPGDVGAVPVERTVNGHVLSDDVVLTSSDTGSVPDTRTINGHVLSDDVVLSKDDVGLGSVTDDAQLAISHNLSDLTDIEEARNNLDVYSKGEVDSTIDGVNASINLLTTHVNTDFVPKTIVINGHELSADIVLSKDDIGLGSITNDAQLKIASNLSDIANTETARTNLGLGSLATQNANAAAITGGTAALSSLSLSTPLPLTSGGTGATTAAAARTALGLGTAATTNIGTSGSTVPLLSTANTWSAGQTFSGSITVGSSVTLNGQQIYSIDNTLSEVGLGINPRHVADMKDAPKGFIRTTTATIDSPSSFGGAGYVSQYDGSPSYSGMLVQPDGNRVFAGGVQPSQNSGKWQWHEVPTLDRSNTFNQPQVISNQLTVSRDDWPAINLDVTGGDDVVGRRVRIENSQEAGKGVIFYFRDRIGSVAGQGWAYLPPISGYGTPIGLAGGLAPTGSSQAATGTDMNVVNQGWQAVGGTWSNGPLSGNIYGSLFTQATQGLNVGGTSAMGTTNQWYQQRFYDTSNRIYSRIQTNVAAWGAWAQITTSSVSDERAKNIGEKLDLNIALNNISQMDFVNFTFKSDEDETPRRGVVSQQIMNIDPQYVKEVGDLYHLDETPMMLDGLAAIKALKIKNDELAAEIETLKVLVQSLLDNK
ncbi:tail fiber domain-containing protein [Escherichia coli]|uniref:tail fiber domain-containing protein n=1 Tax=Escherichia coli TaxID=562 RepID=UPI0006A1B822|nr:tail fiber domain-containing protein [Escherichia coli]EFA9088679.1 tail fiber domain-containing protein [Escherichia coli]EFH4218277.1 tail fiber domain-containing protein [Escherichia coli]EHH4316885.1 tail fiber domain-containing protein [Escherichia coli]EJG9299313.1 tail fiber domain-containing protein [Escherichia coli]EJZ2647544.1 tail fiber domain-containing protein [Escherichia coli]